MQMPISLRHLALIALATLLGGCASSPQGDAGKPLPSRSAATVVDDQVIESSALDKLYSDPRLAKKIHINVTSYNRVVLLSGEVLSAELRRRAVDIVRNLPKVRRVHNEIRIKDLTGFQSRSRDGWITSKIKARMLATKGFDSDRVKVLTEEGTVFLMGLVSRQQGRQAAEIARNVDGVRQVVKLFEYLD